jgi:phosphatidylethanolamine-binding protein (PEBP) family uncharacterized protein
MRRLAFIAASLFATHSYAMSVEVENIHDGDPIPMKHAFCEATPNGKSTQGENIRPTIRWSGAPEGTKSFLVVVRDLDVPVDFTNAGKEGKTVANDAPRRPAFYHWGVADVPAGRSSLPGGAADSPAGVGTAYITDMASYVGHPSNYGGPCPPWNDERLHHYEYMVNALDVETLKLPDAATVGDAEKAAAKHTLASAKVTGTYTLNQALMK